MGRKASTNPKKQSKSSSKKSTTSERAIDPAKNLSYLASTKSDKEILAQILKNVVKVTNQKETLTIELKDGFMFKASPPAKRISPKYPKSFDEILKHHQTLSLQQGVHVVLELGQTGIFDIETLRDNDSPILDFVKKPKDLIFPLSEWQDCWVYHPGEKNEVNEPVIYFLSHETLEPTQPQECNIGSLFLLRCAHHLKIEVSESKPKNGGGFIELDAKPNKLLKNTRCLNLSDGKILSIGKGEISLLEISDNKFKLLGKSKFPLDNQPDPDTTMRCQELKDGTIMIEIKWTAIFLFKLEKNTPILINTLEKDYNGCAAVVVDKTLCFYNDDDSPHSRSKSPGFYFKSLSNPEKKSFFKIKCCYVTSGVSQSNLIILVGFGDIFGFELKENNVKQIFKIGAEFTAPVIVNAPVKDHFIVFNDTSGITHFKYEKALKKVSTFYNQLNAIQWCWVKLTLYVLLYDNKKEKYFIALLNWEKNSLQFIKRIDFSLKYTDSSNGWLIRPMSVHVHSNIMYIVNKDGLVWEVKVD